MSDYSAEQGHLNLAPFVSVSKRSEKVSGTISRKGVRDNFGSRFYGGEPFNRTHTTLVCFVLALDASGKTEAAEISYPAGVRLTAKERAALMSTTWSPTMSRGHSVPSLASISLSSSVR